MIFECYEACALKTLVNGIGNVELLFRGASEEGMEINCGDRHGELSVGCWGRQETDFGALFEWT